MSRHVADDTPCRSNFGQMGLCRRHYFFDVVAVCVGSSQHLLDFSEFVCRNILWWYGGTYAQILCAPTCAQRSFHMYVVLLLPQQHITQPQHTTTKMSGRRPPSGGFCPSVSMGRGDLPPTSSRRCSLTSVRRLRAVGLALAGAGSFVWGARRHPSKMREVGGASTLMAAVRFKNTTINQ